MLAQELEREHDADSILDFEDYMGLLTPIYYKFSVSIKYSLLEKEDVFSIFGLMYTCCIKKYDSTKGIPFHAYLKQACINQLIEELAYQNRGIHLTRKYLKKVAEALKEEQSLGVVSRNPYSDLPVIHGGLGYTTHSEYSPENKNYVCPFMDTTTDKSIIFSDFTSSTMEEFISTLNELDSSIVMYKMEGFNQAEVAKMLGVTSVYITRKLKLIQARAVKFWEVNND